MNKASRYLEKLNHFYPYILLIIAGLGVAIVVLLQQTVLTVFSLILIIPLVLAALIILTRTGKTFNNDSVNISLGNININHLLLIYVLLFVVSLILLVSSETRPLAYFVVVSICSGVIFLQIFCKKAGYADNIIIIEIILLSLNIIWGVTLKYPLNFADTDILAHMDWVDFILDTAHTATAATTYEMYPLYHIYNAIGVEITGLTLRDSIYLIMGIIWQAGTIFTYLIFRRLSNSKTLPLVASLIYSLSSQVIFYGIYSIARSLAFIFFIFLLYLLLYNGNNRTKYILLSLIVIPALILSHHLTSIYVILILLIVYVCSRIVVRISNSNRNGMITLSSIMLYSLAAVAYLVFVASNLMGTTLIGKIKILFTLEAGIKSDLIGGYGVIVVLGQIYYAFLLLLCLLGVKRLLSVADFNKLPINAYKFALAGCFMCLIYMPGLRDLFAQTDLIWLSRSIFLLSPFIAFLAAFGMEYLLEYKIRYNLTRNTYIFFLSVMIIALSTFFSLIGTGNAQDCDYFPHTASTDTSYFNNAELESFWFINNNADTSLPLYSDYQTTRNTLWLKHFKYLNIIKNPDIDYIEDGYILLRNSELEKRGALSFRDDHAGIYRYSPDPLNTKSDIRIGLSLQNEVYCNGLVNIYLMCH